MTRTRKRVQHKTNADRYRCNAPDCDNPADLNEAVWWTPYGSTCSEICAWRLINAQPVE